MASSTVSSLDVPQDPLAGHPRYRKVGPWQGGRRGDGWSGGGVDREGLYCS